MFSCVGQIFSKGYKIHIHEFFSYPAICLCPDQRRGQQDNYLHDETEGFSLTECLGTCLSICLSVSLSLSPQ